MKFIKLHSRGGNYLVVASNIAWLRSAENGQTNVGMVGGQPLLVVGSIEEVAEQILNAAADQEPPAATPAPAATDTGPELAVSEKADFDRAKEVLGQGDFRTAADLFATFTQSYPGGPLTQEAHYLRGEALSQSGDTAGAARSYLEAFSGQPSGPQAAVKASAVARSNRRGVRLLRGRGLDMDRRSNRN